MAVPRLGQNHYFFRAKAKFFGQKPAKMKKIAFIKRKTEFILSGEMKCPKSGIFTIITGWGESGKVILQNSIAVFSGTVEKFFGQRWLSVSLPRKNRPVRL